MQAMILAAGMGKRLKELTSNATKCMVEVNGVTMIERMLSQLDKRNLQRIVIVVGYEGQKLMDYIESLEIRTPIIYVNNEIYYKTNNIYSLFLARNYLTEDDTILLESDLIFEDAVLQRLWIIRIQAWHWLQNLKVGWMEQSLLWMKKIILRIF